MDEGGGKVKGGLLLDVIFGEGATVLKLLASEDQTLLVGRDTLLVLNFGLDVVDSVGGFDFEGDDLAGQGLNEDVHSTTETKDQVDDRLLLEEGQDGSPVKFRPGGEMLMPKIVADRSQSVAA